MFGKVAVLMGGNSAEREISLMTGDAVLKSLLRQGIDAHGIDARDNYVNRLQKEGFSRVFIALHGRGGEDGVVQGLLEVLRIPYTGSGVLGSALTMDKIRTKRFLASLGYPTPPWVFFTKNSDPHEIAKLLEFPLIVKPVFEGSSKGVYKVLTIDELKQAYEKSSKYGPVIAEKFIAGDEYCVGILSNKTLPSIQVIPQADFYDYESKYFSDKTKYICPSNLSDEQEKHLQNLVLTSFIALGCSDWGRTELIRDLNGDFWILDVNTIPGLTKNSLVPKAAKAIGMDFDALVIEILNQTLVTKEKTFAIREKGSGV